MKILCAPASTLSFYRRYMSRRAEPPLVSLLLLEMNVTLRNRAGNNMLGFGTIALAILAGTARQATAQLPLTTAFTYQGELTSTGSPAAGTYDIRFRLFDAPSGGSQIGSTLCSDNLAVTAGRFAASLDFGSAAFNGQQRYLEIEVRQDSGLDCSDDTGYTPLTPRQELTAAPHATFAASAASAATLDGQPPAFYRDAANLQGTLPGTTLPTNIARLDSNQTFTGQLNFSNPANNFSGNGAGLTNLAGEAIAAGSLLRTSLSGDTRLSLASVTGDWSRTPYVLHGGTQLSAPGRAIAASGTNAYVATGTSFQVFDTTDFTRPRLIGSAPLSAGTRAVTLSGTRAFVVTDSSTLHIFDISVPSAPVELSRTSTTLPALSVAISGSFAFVVVNGASQAPGILQVYDISNPALPVRIIGVGTGGRAKSVAVSGSFAYVVNEISNTLQVYSIANPAQPTLLGATGFSRAPQNIAVVGSVAYVTLTGTGQVPSNSLNVYNVSNPAAPTFIGSALTATVPSGLAISGNYAFVTGSGTGLQVFNIATPASPSLISSVPTAASAAGVAVSDFAFVISDSAQLQSIGGQLGLSFSYPLAADVTGNATTATNASQLGGQPASFYTSAANLSSGILANARTTGTSAPSPNTLVLRDASGNFAAGTITAALNGSATQLNAQPASFYTNASNLTSGTLPDARLSTSIPRLNTNNSFTSTSNSFAGRLGVNTPAGALELDVNGRINVASGVIQKDLSAGVVTGTTDLGLYSQIAGGWIRMVTNNAQFAWFSDSGAGTTPRMVLSPAGNLTVSGSLAKAGGSFKIDHPLDPENKYLYHSFVESPDMMNIYNGNITTDGRGFAVVELPDYFEALNRDFRYQLTVLDDSENDFILTKVYREIGVDAPRQFTIKSSLPNIKVSWQVTGIRQDAWAKKNRIPNSVDKPAAEKGTLLHPEAFGKPASPAAADLQPATR